MKFANIWDLNNKLSDSTFKAINIGDYLQFMIIDYLYNNFLSNNEEVKKLHITEIKKYKGELLVLPLNWSLFDINYMEEGKIAISDDIIPVFLAMTIEATAYCETYFNNYNISYLKRHEPIGCRDAYTMKKLQYYGIKAYLNGCLTSILPRRKETITDGKKFFIDVPIEVKKHIPDNLKQNSVVMTHQYYYQKDIPLEEIMGNITAQYRKYAEEADLVVTSRLHAVSPCLALGIPVIFVKNQVDARFDWIDKYIPLYDIDSYDKIDWHPQIVEYEETKTRIIDNAIKRMKEVYDKYTRSEHINQLYENREERDYINFQKTIYDNLENAYTFLQASYHKTDVFLYSIWGCNRTAESFYKYMCTWYPNAKLKDVIDSYKKIEFHGRKTITPDDFIIQENEIIFVLPVKASSAAREFFKRKKISDKQYICCSAQFIEETDF